MATEEDGEDVLVRTFFWTMVGGVLFVVSGFIIVGLTVFLT